MTIKCSCRSFFVYKNGELFMQLVETYRKPDGRMTVATLNRRQQILSLTYGDSVTLCLPSFTVYAKFSHIKGTGVVFHDWTMISTVYNDDSREASWIESANNDGFFCSACGTKHPYGESAYDFCSACGRKMRFQHVKTKA